MDVAEVGIDCSGAGMDLVGVGMEVVGVGMDVVGVGMDIDIGMTPPFLKRWGFRTSHGPRGGDMLVAFT
ncbi:MULTISPECIES: hypothetical protein [Streptomyces]|uniref:hypothetical protein n=1 Tax=Streptomyces TaxID=1883 RepID=UPI001E4F0C85|nr:MULTISPECIES: hypothetical protein [Streptomyces]UFQ19219.1 hypothetical protein J2N69_31950 [Streptomyces huasconensis]WCL88838.1 hypothetical protein PPN52_31905 [Streptomyces sp. JCM 35825]